MGLSICTQIRDRNFFLSQTLPTWIKYNPDEIVIFDMPLKEYARDIAFDYGFDKIRVIEVQDVSKYQYNLTKTMNSAIRNCVNDLVFYLDSDVLINDDFLKDLYVPENSFFRDMSGDGGITGTCLFWKKDFLAINGYNERMSGWGYLDEDFYNRLSKNGCDTVGFPQGLQHIKHGDSLRIKHHKINDVWESRNKNEEISRTSPWSLNDIQEEFPCIEYKNISKVKAMPKLAVVTITIGESNKKLAPLTHPTIKKYAEKIGAEFIVIDKEQVSKKFPHYEKFQLYDYLLKYDRIIYVDTDLIIRDDCPNLFDIVPSHSVGAFNEGLFVDCLDIMRDTCKKYKVSISKWDRQYYNAGVMVVSRLHRQLFVQPEEEFDIYGAESKVAHYEQPYLNAIIFSNEFKHFDIGYKFNRVSIMDSLTGEDRKSSYIIHYAGAPMPPKFDLIKEDIFSWAEKSPDYFYQKRIQIDLGGGLGDQIDSEPVVRYIRDKVYPAERIRVVTHFPTIMKHLGVEVIKAGDRIDPTEVFFRMEALPGPDKPLWTHLSQTLCHTTDFASISCLRRILPDEDKQIQLNVDPRSLKRLENIVPSMEKLVLIHPGRGFESKTFPNQFWQSVIDMVSEKYPVAVIGKYISEEQGLVDIECKGNVIDLRNILSLEELIVLISKAPVLISNDSAPIHIAGAFDNWIVLIPSCKHPDHVLPYRKGSKGYKTRSLYKKLTCDKIDSSPTQVYGQTIDYVVGDIMDYLPDPDTLKACIQEIY